jgi:hypothetical protein
MQIFVKTLTGKTTSPWPNGRISDKSLPRTTSPALTSAWAQKHDSGEATNACEEANLHVMRERQLATMQTTCPGRSLKCEPDWPRSHHIAINLRSATLKTQPEALNYPLRRARAYT